MSSSSAEESRSKIPSLNYSKIIVIPKPKAKLQRLGARDFMLPVVGSFSQVTSYRLSLPDFLSTPPPPRTGALLILLFLAQPHPHTHNETVEVFFLFF